MIRTNEGAACKGRPLSRDIADPRMLYCCGNTENGMRLGEPA
ncbi:hypothetical protein [Tsuneonella aeria]|nr:hypothetical protein [Tsuneonella aeria]